MKVKPIRIFTDGSGQRLDGKGSGFAWCHEDLSAKLVTREDGLTNNQAEYRGILSAPQSVNAGASVEIVTDSENTCCQLNGQRRVLDSQLLKLHSEVHSIAKKKHLRIKYSWIPRQQNLAGKLL
jgi:ribonuclease HI